MRFSLASVFLGAAWLARAHSDCVTTYAPLPSTAAGPPVNSQGFRVQSFGGGAYMLTDGTYQSLFFVTRKSVIMVDAPPTTGENILAGIRSVTDLPISHLVYSHSHADHIGAAYLVAKKGVTIVAHELTASELALTPDAHRPQPHVTFKHSHTLRVDNQTIQLDYKGPVHEPGNIFIYAPKQKVLMLIDIVFPGWVPFSSLAEAQSPAFFIKAHDLILDYDFDYYIGGHVDRHGVRKDVIIQREYVQDVYNNARKALILSGSPPNATNPVSASALLGPIQAANPGNAWAMFNGYIDALSKYCADLTTKKWLGKLGGADVYTYSHCDVLVNSLRIDYGVLGPFGVQSK
ncbi:beta-lactamase domain-containing [Trichoderma arundinaceum]|uniref:Beta-lactamase domain-containing n=1 Tax=Trichoderma arundinaceum TaxID=490622 RepID=A0A395NRR4_TRIAR|nr:beta-lactamase domain-containing [Trichoderma arundinaceum]